jgi:hypothetical protein
MIHISTKQLVVPDKDSFMIMEVQVPKLGNMNINTRKYSCALVSFNSSITSFSEKKESKQYVK